MSVDTRSSQGPSAPNFARLHELVSSFCGAPTLSVSRFDRVFCFLRLRSCVLAGPLLLLLPKKVRLHFPYVPSRLHRVRGRDDAGQLREVAESQDRVHLLQDVHPIHVA